MTRTYTCASCGGPVTKDSCPTKNNGLGKWRCVRKGCTRQAQSMNKAGAMRTWTNERKEIVTISPVRTAQSPKAVVRVKLVA